jgi:hypothetical protein
MISELRMHDEMGPIFKGHKEGHSSNRVRSSQGKNEQKFVTIEKKKKVTVEHSGKGKTDVMM